MSSGPSLPANPAAAYQYPNMGQAASGALGGANNINTEAQNVNSGYGSAPANTGATALTSNTGNLVNDANSALGMTAFNPAQYQQQYQRQQDQTNATLAQQGVAGTPYGAGIAAQQNQNFNNDWNTNQVGLENTAANTASSLTGAASTGLGAGTAVGQSIATLPAQQQQQAIADFLAYLSGGTSATNAATGQYSAEAQAALGQQQQDSSALGGLGSLLGSGAKAASLFL